MFVPKAFVTRVLSDIKTMAFLISETIQIVLAPSRVLLKPTFIKRNLCAKNQETCSAIPKMFRHDENYFLARSFLSMEESKSPTVLNPESSSVEN